MGDDFFLGENFDSNGYVFPHSINNLEKGEFVELEEVKEVQVVSILHKVKISESYFKIFFVKREVLRMIPEQSIILLNC
jgi:hypothetical protein